MCLIICICIVFLSFILQKKSNIYYELYDKKNFNIKVPITSNDYPEYLWNITWGGNDDDYGSDIAFDSAEYIYITGFTESFGAGDADIILVKYNRLGEQQWNTTWGGSYSEQASCNAIDSLNNIYLAGFTHSFGAGSGDMFLVKYDSSGVKQWNTTWGGSDGDLATAIALDSSDNIYLAGFTSSFEVGGWDIILVKYNSLGEQQWNTTWGGDNNDYGYAVALDSSDNIYLAGETRSSGAGHTDIVLVKYNSLGEQQWNTTWGGGFSHHCATIALDSLDNIYLAGFTHSFGVEDYDMFLVKYNNLGEQQWNSTWGGNDDDYGSDIAFDSAEYIYITGFTESFGAGGTDIILVKYNSLGEQQWNTTWGGSGEDMAISIAIDSLNNIFLGGYTSSFGIGGNDLVLVKYGKTAPSKYPGPFTLGSDAGTPDGDGLVTLSWNESSGADNYTVYSYSGYITEINSSVTKIQEDLTNRSLLISSLVNGTYYYIVVANNKFGSTLSNCIKVVVAIPFEGNSEITIPGYPIIVLFGISFLILSYIYEKTRIK